MEIIRDKLAQNVLEKNQLWIKPILEEFSDSHFLVWWTAIALQIWHRKSIDFDLFCLWKQWTWKQIFERIKKTWLKFDPKKSNLLWLSDEEQPEVTIFVNWVKIQLLDFSRNPFDEKINLKLNKTICNWIQSLDLLNLWALKLYAMMYRSKRKDAVDLYFILKSWYKLEEILEKTESVFWKLYKSKYSLETIIENKRDMTEKVDYVIKNSPKEEEIKKYIIDEADRLIEKI